MAELLLQRCSHVIRVISSAPTHRLCYTLEFHGTCNFSSNFANNINNPKPDNNPNNPKNPIAVSATSYYFTT